MPRTTVRNNHIAEWFGHRIHPTVAHTPASISDQRSHRCPFLTAVSDEPVKCIKNRQSLGVCTVSAKSNGSRQDWVVCPYRVFDPALIDNVAARLFGIADPSVLETHAAPTLREARVQQGILERLRSGGRVLIYFRKDIGGEISLSKTARSPEMAFDVTFVELELAADSIRLGRFAILELQTMDFHGSYKHAVDKLAMAVSLFPDAYPQQLEQNPEWAGDHVEGPNIANVVKRTFWQMFFKFSFGEDPRCAGTALAIPRAVWDSWQPFLAAPVPTRQEDGTYRLAKSPDQAIPEKIPAWIYVFDIDAASQQSPNPVVLDMVIGALPGALVHHALTEAPRFASEALLADAGIYASLSRRIKSYWPEQTLTGA